VQSQVSSIDFAQGSIDFAQGQEDQAQQHLDAEAVRFAAREQSLAGSIGFSQSQENQAAVDSTKSLDNELRQSPELQATAARLREEKGSLLTAQAPFFSHCAPKQLDIGN